MRRRAPLSFALASTLLLAALPLTTGAPNVEYHHSFVQRSPEDITVDSAGHAYVVGGAYGEDTFELDAFVTKLAPGGAEIWSRQIGGSARDYASHVTIDPQGNLFVAGFTNSADFPATAGAWRTQFAGDGDSWLAKLDASGNVLWATYVGGSAVDSINGIDWAPSGQVAIGGFTSSCDFPVTSGAFQTSLVAACGFSGDAFVAKVAADGTHAVFASLLGGETFDNVLGVAVSRTSGTVMVAGLTNSDDFPTTSGAYQRTVRNQDGFVAKFSSSGASLSFSTLLGGSDMDVIYDVARDAAGNAYVVGSTWSDDLPATAGAFQTSFGGGTMCSFQDWRSSDWVERVCEDAFVARVHDGGGSLDYLTYVGTEYQESAVSLALDAAGTVYVTGQTNSTTFPLIDARTSVAGETRTTFTLAVAPNGKGLAYSQRLPGSRVAEGVDALGNGTSFHAGASYFGEEWGYADRIGVPTPGLVLSPRGGNANWVETFVGGTKAGSVSKVEARDNDTGWTTLAKSEWGFYAGSLSVDKGPLRLRATASDGTSLTRCYEWPSRAPAACPSEPTPTVSFTHGGGNEWWAEVKVAPHPVSVQAMDDGGPWTSLSFKSWGEWAASFHIEPGHRVKFRATYADGTTVESCSFTHPAGIAGDEDGTHTCTGGGTGPEPDPDPSTFEASFRNVRGNQWWIEADVDVAGGTLAGVDTRVNGGSWIALEKKSYGSWAKSIHAATGSTVQFRARATDGSTDISGSYTWPPI